MSGGHEPHASVKYMWYLGGVTRLGKVCPTYGKSELHGDLLQPANHHPRKYRVTRCSPVDSCFCIVVNLDASGISKDVFVQFVGDHDGCLFGKARDKPDLVWSNNIRLFLNCF